MKRIIPLVLSSAAFIVAFPPALKAQDINIGPGGVTTLAMCEEHRSAGRDVGLAELGRARFA
ncbi:MAG: hypothetical protein JO170_02105 [Verrucomicrobia bacterium]|jgi:hypothetical protein|nr:hypothetical protein [Verrucomicrobiota bacterium]